MEGWTADATGLGLNVQAQVEVALAGGGSAASASPAALDAHDLARARAGAERLQRVVLVGVAAHEQALDDVADRARARAEVAEHARLERVLGLAADDSARRPAPAGAGAAGSISSRRRMPSMSSDSVGRLTARPRRARPSGSKSKEPVLRPSSA